MYTSRSLLIPTLILALAACGDDGGGGGVADVGELDTIPGDTVDDGSVADAPGDVPGGPDARDAEPDGSPDSGSDGGPGEIDETTDTVQIPKPVPEQVVFTEIMNRPAAVDDAVGEWFELKNIGEVDANLDGCLIDSEGDTLHTIHAGEPLVIPAQGHLVMGRSSDEAVNGGVQVDYVVHTGLGDNGDRLTLSCGGTTIDQVEYDAGDGWPSADGVAIQLAPDVVHPDDRADPANWCLASEAYGDGDLGTPGADNPPCEDPLAIERCRLQGPETAEVLTGEDVTFTGRVNALGLTDATSGTDEDPALVAQIGYGGDGSDPSADDQGWTWLTAEPDEAWDDGPEPGFDQYLRTFTAPEAGAYDVAFRVSVDGEASWTVCDLDTGEDGEDGSQDGYQVSNAGNLTVLSNPCVPNPCDDPPADTCAGDVLDEHPGEGTCTIDGDAAACEYTPVQVDCATLGTTCEEGTCVGVDSPPTPGAVVISEIMKDPAAVADSDGEWFEVVNPTAKAYDLQGCRLESENDAGHTIEAGGPLVLGAGERIVFGLNDDEETNGGLVVDYVYSGLTLANGDDFVRLVCEELVDEVAYDTGSFPNTAGVAMQLDPGSLDAAANDLGGSWCDATAPYGDGDLGTPGEANAPCPDPCEGVSCEQPPTPDCAGDVAQTYAEEGTCTLGSCSYPVADSTDCAAAGEVCFGGKCYDEAGLPVQPGEGEVVITEIMRDPGVVPDATGEWIELTNLALHAVVLDGCTVSSDNDSPWDVPPGAGLVMEADGGRLVLARNADPAENGGVTADIEYSGLVLGNGDDAVELACGEETIDRVAYDGGPGFPATEGAAMQLDPSAFDADENDDGANWCEAIPVFGDGDRGTPGEANHPCDPCEGLSCEDPPGPECDGDTALVYEASGTCTDGECAYAVADEIDCTQEGLVCDGGGCVEPEEFSWPADSPAGQCVDSGDCPEELTCNADAPGGLCQGCGTCPSGYDCNFGTCNRWCDDDSDCPVGLTCHGTQAVCVSVLCDTDAECEGPYVCRDGICGRPTCESTADCPAPLTCAGGLCVEPD